MTGILSRLERFVTVGSTNDVVAGWLAGGLPEVAVAVADTQTAGRGREGRDWVAPTGAALLVSAGFRPTWLEPDRVWRLAAVMSLAMSDAAEEVAGLPDGAIRLKWPNDLVILQADATGADPEPRKLAGVLGETAGLGTADPRAVVGIGINADWRAADFPPDLAPSMTSLRQAAGGRPVDREVLLDAFLDRLEVRVAALRTGRFDVADWTGRQLTTGRLVRLAGPGRDATARALGVDASSGALVIEDPDAPGGERHVLAGEVRSVRMATPAGEAV